ncbi:hypothetical protein [Telluria beijingensis]|uniref:hypothetical protein n=1 Tax=Telluria beijingensis TaxID=3068633 RepID=UPI00279595B9|nr:hypothetical protein [Massilia sp. REN29]
MVSRAFADVLAAGRSSFNDRVRETERRFPAFRADTFLWFLKEGVDPVVVAVDQLDRSRLSAVVSAGYDVALELAGRALVGPSARSPALGEAWRSLFPHLAGLIAAQPATVLGLLSNAIIHLEGIGGARVGQWTDELALLAPHLQSVEQLRVAGQVLAWRAGAAHFRDGAMAAAAALPEGLALRAFGALAWSGWQAFRQDAEHDPWWSGGDPHAMRERRVGGFSGFGGPFAMPPEILAAGEAFLVKSGDRHCLLVADTYGAVLRPADAEEFAFASVDAPRCAYKVRDGVLLVGSRRIELDVPEPGLVVCATAATIAIASPYTHTIRLLARGER